MHKQRLDLKMEEVCFVTTVGCKEALMNIIIDLSGRIDSTNSNEIKERAEAQISVASQNPKEVDITFNADKLEYISSAGLRVLLQIKKSVKDIQLINVSKEVNEIFRVTGFDGMFKVSEKLRQVSADGLEIIGQGATSKVYRLDSDTVIKVFAKDIPFETVIKEQEMTKTAFRFGIPTMISYDIVKVGDCYGSVAELLRAKTILSLLEDDPDNEDEYCRIFADFVRESHGIEIDSEEIEPCKNHFYSMIDEVQRRGLYTADEADRARQIVLCIPSANYFVHGDCHPGNVMMLLDTKEVLFIDLPTLSKGHKVFDLAGMRWFAAAPDVLDDDTYNRFYAIDRDRIKRIYRKILKYYLQSEDDNYVDSYDKALYYLECFNLSFSDIYAPGLISKSKLEFLKEEGLKAVDIDFTQM